MNTATQLIVKFASAAAIALLLTNCAATTQGMSKSADAVVDCSNLDWDTCATTTECRHARDWVKSDTGYEETFTCESKPPVFAAGPQSSDRIATSQ
ncbi:MAG TPA: hypothetical protein EYN06_02410 [Myxococcales bacterium]|nr:hypothetical protein [Myxococcales bacterium]HIN85305.1 hypothetical protein [Myxococcales bacterium]